ncbi:CRISPR-associated protein, partial [Peptococcaceae bacterium]|nr:CRISPR-associated protein [Peptococcaceae bacterium]
KSEKDFFEPSMKKLKSCFGPESGIDSAEKAFAFLLGILYGKLLEVQGAKGVNVGANALTWLKRLTLKGRDLPELYTKIRAKLLAYGTESNAEVRELLAELSRLGIKLGDEIRLDEVKTNYYLLLGQAMSKEVLPSKKEGDKK